MCLAFLPAFSASYVKQAAIQAPHVGGSHSARYYIPLRAYSVRTSQLTDTTFHFGTHSLPPYLFPRHAQQKTPPALPISAAASAVPFHSTPPTCSALTPLAAARRPTPTAQNCE